MSSNKLRVLIIGLNYAPESTGNAPYTASLAEGLIAAGHDVRILTGYPHYPEWKLRDGYSGWSRREVINSVEVTRLRHHIPNKLTNISRMHMELSFGVRLIFARWSRPDAVLVVSPALFSSALAILRVRMTWKRPAVAIWVQDIYSRGIAETGSGNGRLSKVFSAVESLVLRSADGIVAIHDRFKKHIVCELGVSQNDVCVIRNWTHLPDSPTTGKAEIRSRLGWKAEDVVVLHAGNMGKKQGLENVVEAARIAESRGSAVRFVLMGDGNQRERIEASARGISKISFIDPLPDSEFQHALAGADILLVNELPGVRDMAVPSKLTSYFNAGVPVIAATDHGSVTAYEIEHSGGGVRVDAAAPLALVEAAEALANDAARATHLAENALRFRHETLSESVAVGHYDEYITSLALSRGR